MLLVSLALSYIRPVRADFALRDGDTVVFLGDSITAARGYSRVIENYTLLRYPARNVHFINTGKGGDTASGGLARLERDVFSRHATVLTVAFGINDIGWGLEADAEHKKRYLDAIREIVQRCYRTGVRVFICSPAITSDAPDHAEQGFLQTMSDEGLALAKSLGAGTIDVQRGMREIQRRIVAANALDNNPKNHTVLHADDGVHLNELGQLAMAYVILKGLGAPADVSSASIDAAAGRVLRTQGCKVSAIKKLDENGQFGGVEFTREDEGLPLNLGILGALNFRFITIPDGLNRYLLAVKYLPSGQYEIRAENRLLGTASAQQLSDGLNISSMTADGWEPGGPWDAQAGILKELTDARNSISMATLLRTNFLPNLPRRQITDLQTVQTEEDLIVLQRQVARPFPYHFELLRQTNAPPTPR